jgi:hypothetical protein
MQDEEYQAQQIPEYGGHAQPALVERMAPELRMTLVGTLCAALAVVTSVVALVVFPDFGGATRGPDWAVVAIVVSLVMMVVTFVQLMAWRRAMAVWRGERSDDLAGATRVSWFAHLLSYLVVLVGLWACIAGSIAAGTSTAAATLLGFALLFLLLAQILAGVQYLRTVGPSGTIPGHLRRLSTAIQRRR